MKAVRIHEYGGPEVLVYEEVPTAGAEAEPGPGARRGGLGQPDDIAVREDRFPTPKDPPKIIGTDGAGVVEGPATRSPPSARRRGPLQRHRHRQRGQLRGVCRDHRGPGRAEACRARFVDAAALGLVFPTAYYGLVNRGHCRPARPSRPGRRRRRRFGVDPARQGAWCPGDQHRGRRREAASSSAGSAPTRPSTTRPRTSWPRKSSPAARRRPRPRARHQRQPSDRPRS